MALCLYLTFASRRGGGGTADALGSGPSEGNLVEVQILSAAPVAGYLARVLRAIIAGIVPGRHASGVNAGGVRQLARYKCLDARRPLFHICI